MDINNIINKKFLIRLSNREIEIRVISIGGMFFNEQQVNYVSLETGLKGSISVNKLIKT